MTAELHAWYKAEYQRRTLAVEAGTSDIDWIVPEYRVTWTEVLAKAEALGLSLSIVELRTAFEASASADKYRQWQLPSIR